MKGSSHDHNRDHEKNNKIVLSDSDIAKFDRGREVFVRLLLKQRHAMFTKAKALGERASGSEEPALELWKEMPQAAKEFEAFDSS